MASPRPVESSADFRPFFERVRGAPARVLLLDYDGTLAPFGSDRRRPRLYAGVRPVLGKLARAPRRTRLGIVSGRPVADLQRFLGMGNAIELWGSHGIERLRTDGCWIGPPPSPDASRLLGELAALIVAHGGDEILERKPYGLAVHRRGAPPGMFERAVALLPQWTGPARAAGLALAEFDGGLELRPAHGNKGMVVEQALREAGEEAAAAYLGDDWTDEDAFRALRGRGLPVLVRREPRPTHAEAWLRPPRQLVEFLSAWNTACSEGSS
jgi:trehalose 6-phosphate phosphatase